MEKQVRCSTIMAAQRRNDMSAYVIALINVTDQEGYAPYRDMATASIAQYGGKYLARGGSSEVLEGETDANRFVIVQFDTYDQAKTWFDSPEYEAAKPHRRRNSTSTLMLVEGLS
jgi:uncharacterized protein (DUF1330 family)